MKNKQSLDKIEAKISFIAIHKMISKLNHWTLIEKKLKSD